jgi:ABC-type transport system involved in multi-copper enzyme maturation permease subunit
MPALEPSPVSWPRRLASSGEMWIGAALVGSAAVLVLIGALRSEDSASRLNEGKVIVASGVILALAFVVLFAVAWRRGWVKLFGPVLFYDLVRTARRSRAFLLRSVYAASLLVMLFFCYSDWFGGSILFQTDVFFGANTLPPGEVARFAEDFFTNFLLVQLGMVFLLTPAYTATAIAEEKERRTLDFLLATDLRSREIVLGKLISRLAHLSLFVLSGLPILGFLQLLGGIDPNLLLVGFAGTALTMLSLASLGIFNSAYCDRPPTAIFFTYLQAGLFFLFSFPMPGLRYGNPVAAWHELMHAAALGSLANAASSVLGRYAAVHGFIAVLCCVWAAVKVRAWGRVLPSRTPEPLVLKVTYRDRSSRKDQTLIWRELPLWPRPRRLPIKGHPLLWKELHLASGLRLGDAGKALVVFTLLINICFFGISLVMIALVRFAGHHAVNQSVNIWVRCYGTAVGTLLLAWIAVRAAGTFTGEREHQTLDVLLTTPQSDAAILWAKGWGSIYGVRGGWWWLGVIWMVGVLFSGLSPFCVAPLAGCWLAHATLIAGIGVWFSLASRTTLRATLYTLLTIAAWYAGPFLLGSVSDLLWMAFGWDQEPQWFANFCTLGIAAPASLWTLAGNWPDLLENGEEYRAAMIGIPFTTLVAAAVWGLASAQFVRRTGRMSASGCGGQLLIGRTAHAAENRERDRLIKNRPTGTAGTG